MHIHYNPIVPERSSGPWDYVDISWLPAEPASQLDVNQPSPRIQLLLLEEEKLNPW
jgi:hypothetical protein